MPYHPERKAQLGQVPLFVDPILFHRLQYKSMIPVFDARDKSAHDRQQPLKQYVGKLEYAPVPLLH